MAAFSTPDAASIEKVQLDLRSHAVHFLNDLERDKRYKKWSTNLQEYLRPAAPGQIRQIGKNAITAVFFIDPSQRQDIDLFLALHAMIEKGYPARFGVLLTSSALLQPPQQFEFAKGFPARFNVSEAAATSSASIMLIRAFSYVKKEEDVNEAFSWLKSFLADHASTSLPTVESVKQKFSSRFGATAWVR